MEPLAKDLLVYSVNSIRKRAPYFMLDGGLNMIICKPCVLAFISWYNSLSIEILNDKTDITSFDIIIFFISGTMYFNALLSYVL